MSIEITSGVNSTAERNDIAALWSAKGTQHKPKRNFNLYCEYCKLKGHTKENCYQLDGYPPNYKGRKKNWVTAKNVIANNVTSFGRHLDQNSNMIPGPDYSWGFHQGYNTSNHGYNFPSDEHRGLGFIGSSHG